MINESFLTSIRKIESTSDPSLLEEYSNHGNWLIRHAVICNNHTSPETLEKISKSNKNLLFNIIKNTNCPPHILENFQETEDINILCCLLRNPALPLSVLESILSKISVYELFDKTILKLILEHPNTSDEIKMYMKFLID